MELMFSSERIKNMLYIINYNDVPESQIRVIKSQIRVIFQHPPQDEAGEDSESDI